MESLSPNIFVHDMDATLAFYRKLGFDVLMSMPEQAPHDWIMMGNGEVTFMFQTFSSLKDELPDISRHNGGSLLFYIKTPKIRALHDRIAGEVKVLKGLEKTFYGATEFAILDNNGYVLVFAEDE
jgi:uncharacterized glyoxalase superfamily protein PhnB